MTIRKNVEFILKAKFMNKAQLAELTGYSPSNLARYLDSDNIGLLAIQNIAKALQVKPADIIAYPYLSLRRPYHDFEHQEERPRKSVTANVCCPSCGEKLKITISEA